MILQGLGRGFGSGVGVDCYLPAEISGDYAGLLRLVTGNISLVEGTGVEHATPKLRT